MTGHVIESPLEAWPGEIHLPYPDEFNRVHWQIWIDGVEKPLRTHYSSFHRWAYTGLELIDACGGWQMEIPIDEVQAWEKEPEAEHTKLIAWIGREVGYYMESILNPKG